MLYCPECNIDYEAGKKFCKDCGSSLILREEVDTAQKPDERQDKSKTSVDTKIIENDKKYCPSCGQEYPSDKQFCKSCGVQLTDTPPPEDTVKAKKRIKTAGSETLKMSFSESGADIPSWFNIRSTLRKRKNLLKKKQKLIMLINNLEKQKGAISEDALNVTIGPYKAQLENIRKAIEEIDNYLHALQRKLSVDMQNLQKDVYPHTSRLSELKSMRRAKGLTFADYMRFRKQPHKESRRITREIKKRQRILRLLQSSSADREKILKLSLKIAGGIVILVVLVTGSYFGYRYLTKGSADETVDITFEESIGSAPVHLPEEEIKKVFENIKQANLAEDINLFMSCYSSSFPLYDEKKDKTISNWKNFDFTNLNFNIQDIIATQDSAEVTVSWQIMARSAETGKMQTFNTTNNVVFQKETGKWKIVNMK